MLNIEDYYFEGLYILDERVKHHWDENLNTAVYDWSALALAELKIEWIKCEKNKLLCHKESAFQMIFDMEMRSLVVEIKKRKLISSPV